MAATSSLRRVALNYDIIRNMTSPEEKANDARSYFANVPIVELLKLDTDANLRDYIPDHPGKQRTQAHKAIDQTLRDPVIASFNYQAESLLPHTTSRLMIPKRS